MMKHETQRRSNGAGVTLIEMLVVVTIIALFAALVAPSMFKRADKAKVTAARAQINNFMTALGTYKLDTGTFPTTEQGLQALRIKPANVNSVGGTVSAEGYSDRSLGPRSPVQIPRRARRRARHHRLGADGQPGGEGINADIVSWKN